MTFEALEGGIFSWGAKGLAPWFLAAGLAGASHAGLAPQPPHACLPYDERTTLSGILKFHPTLRPWWSLELDRPICMIAYPKAASDDSGDLAVAGVTELHLLLVGADQQDLMRGGPLDGRRASAVGTLMPRHTGYHETSVVVLLEALRFPDGTELTPDALTVRHSPPRERPPSYSASLTVAPRAQQVVQRVWQEQPRRQLEPPDSYVSHRFNGAMDCLWATCGEGYVASGARSSTGSDVFPQFEGRPDNDTFGLRVLSGREANITLTCVRRVVAGAASGTFSAGSAGTSLEHLPVRVEGSRLEIVHPASCRIELIDNEEGPAGSAAAYRIHEWPEAEPLRLPGGEPALAWIQFHTLGSIARFDARCLRSTGYIDDDSCYEGWRPHREDLERERLAIPRESSAGACENPLGPGVLTRCAVVESGGKSMISRTRAFNWGAEREYVWFVGDVRVSVAFLLRGDDPALDARADALVAVIAIQAEPER